MTFSNAYFVSSIPGIHSSIPYPPPNSDFETDVFNWVKSDHSSSLAKYNIKYFEPCYLSILDSVNSSNLNSPYKKQQSLDDNENNSYLSTLSTNIVVDESRLNSIFDKLSNLLGTKKKKNDLMSRRLWIKLLDGKLKVFLARY